jgi:hypothetical protein
MPVLQMFRFVTAVVSESAEKSIATDTGQLELCTFVPVRSIYVYDMIRHAFVVPRKGNAIA